MRGSLLTAFDLDTATQRIKGELETLAQELWPRLSQSDRMPAATIEEKIENVHNVGGFIQKPSFEQLKFSMIYYVIDNRYWQAAESWKEIQSKPSMKTCWTEEDTKFYALLIIEKAKTDRDAAIGYHWIVKEYDTGPFRPYIDKELLTWAVNKSFQEELEMHFSKTPKTGVAVTNESYYFDVLSKYLDLVDLAGITESKSGPLVHRLDWPDKSYADAFNRARQAHELKASQEEFLARPIIERYIDWAFQVMSPIPNNEQFLKERLKPYEEYLPTPTVRELLEEKMKVVLKHIAESDSWDDFEMGLENVERLRLLAQLRFTPEQAFEKRISGEPFGEVLRDFISENMPIKEGLAAVLVNSCIPAGLFSDKIRESLEAELTSVSDGLLKKSPRDPTEYLNFVRASLALGYVPQERAEGLIRSGFTSYLSMKPRPSSKVAISIRDAMAHIPIRGELYREHKEKVYAQILEDLKQSSQRSRSAKRAFADVHRASETRSKTKSF